MEEHIEVFSLLKNTVLVDLLNFSEIIASSIDKGGKLIIAGNGGSAADAQHIAAEFLVKLRDHRKALPALAITTDTSVLTAVSNDLSFDDIFARQIEGLGTKNDIFLGLTTSGKSKNIKKALDSSKSLGLSNIIWTGKEKCKFGNIDYQINVPSFNVARVQECHIFLGHLLVLQIEKHLKLC